MLCKIAHGPCNNVQMWVFTYFPPFIPYHQLCVNFFLCYVSFYLFLSDLFISSSDWTKYGWHLGLFTYYCCISSIRYYVKQNELTPQCQQLPSVRYLPNKVISTNCSFKKILEVAYTWLVNQSQKGLSSSSYIYQEYNIIMVILALIG